MPFSRIVVDHRVMGGVPCIRGTRMPVTRILKTVAAWTPVARIVEEFPQLLDDDVGGSEVHRSRWRQLCWAISISSTQR